MSFEITRHLSRTAAALAALALALGAGPASAQVTTMGDGLTALSPTTPIQACPGGAAVRADYFTLQASQTGDWVRAVKVALNPTGAYAGVAQVDIRNSAGTTTYGSIVPAADGFDVQLATTFAVSVASPTEYSIWVTPKGFGAIPTALANSNITAKMILVFNRFARTGADTTSAPLLLDAKAPAEVGWTSLAATTSQVTLNWSVPSDAGSVLVLRDTKPVTDAPVSPAVVTAYGAVGSTFSGGTSTIRFAGTAAPWQVTDTGLTSGKSYYYKAFTRDACGNWSAGEPIGPVVASGGTTEGDPTPSSLKPMVGIINPIPNGVVGNQFKVQARVYSPMNGSNVQAITAVTIAVTKPDGTAVTSGSLTENTQYGNATDSGVFEPSPVLSLSAGQYVLQVTATNGSGSAKSAVVPVTVGAGAGDGNILRRDDSSQLCNDCHALPTHSSEATSNKYGAWYAGCRSCHQPHGTTNASLVANEVRPPQVAAQLPPTRTYYSTTTGYDPTAGATSSTTIAAASFANGDRTGPCQVCHTRTNFYRRAGAAGNGGPTNLAGGADHYTTNCTACHKHTKGFAASCTACHGTPGRVGPAGSDALVAAAPPQDHLGNTLTTSPGVGVHQAHVTGTTWRSTPLACNECHPIPNNHDGVTETQFTGTLSGTSYDWAGAVGGTPTYTRPNCSSMYCHGDFRGGNNAATPSWTAAGSVVCGSCHGVPPANSAHSGVTTSCAGCHPAGYSPTTVNPTTHMDGQLEAAGCNGCHGDPTRTSAVVALNSSFTDAYVSPMPPKDHNGNTLTTALGVGAHNSHVNTPTSLAMPIQCETCHGPLPTDANHSSQPTVVVAAAGYTSPTCTNSCHGTTAMGGTLHAPTWNTVNGTQDACGTCHGLTPPVTDGGHPQNTTCGSCHTGYTSSSVVQATHVNGTLDVNTSTGCARCHGKLGTDAVASGSVDAAPGLPGTFDAHGNSSTVTSAAGVGAHRAHLAPKVTTSFTCTQCHPSPNYTDTTHANGTPAVPFNLIAKTQLPGDPTVPAPSYATNTCASTYCHGNFQGGKNGTPTWSAATLTSMTCTSCHGAPPVPAAASGSVPASYHPNNSNCGQCHTGYTSTTVVASTHVNGAIDRTTTTGCAQCHGKLGTNGVAATSTDAAPGLGANFDAHGNGSTVTTAAGVGAHAAHLSPRWFNGYVACTQCHPSNADKTHANGTATVIFSPSLAGTVLPGDSLNTAPTYAGAGGTCNSVYCHGRFTGGLQASPTWAAAGYTGTSMTCASCHAAPPGDASHTGVATGNKNCNQCHAAAYNCLPGSLGACQVDKTVHINGAIDTQALTCSSCHGQSRTAATTVGSINTTQLVGAPPADLTGATSGGTKIGAHLGHVNPAASGQKYLPLACSDCHTNAVNSYTVAHPDGVLVTSLVNSTAANFGSGATIGFTSGSPGSCVTYCHGDRLPQGASISLANYRGAIQTWTWNTTTTAACNSCHGLPPDPTGTHAGVAASASACNGCHSATVNASGNIIFTGTGASATTKHINGVVDITESSGGAACNTCHAAYYNAMAGGNLHRHMITSATAPGTAGTTTIGTYSTTATAKTCTQCHLDHNLFRPDINTSGSRAKNLRLSATAQPTLTNAIATDYSAGTGVCISCHSTTQTKATGLPDAGQTTPAINSTSYNASAHNYAANPTSTFGDSSTFTANCSKCHESSPNTATKQTSARKFELHASTQASLLDPLGAATTAASSDEEGFCFRCHSDSTDGQGKTVTANDYYGSVTNMSGGSTNVYKTFQETYGHKPQNYSNLHTPSETPANIASNKHVECQDCHSPHGAKAGLHTAHSNIAGAALTAAGGQKPTFTASTNWAAPSSYTAVNLDGTATNGLEAYNCFRCHSNSNTSVVAGINGTTSNVSPWTGATPSGAASFTNTALEFNTNNKSYHPVLGALPSSNATTTYGSVQLSSARLTGGWTPGMTMTCTDCHGADSAAPATQGPHGSAYKFMLTGTNRQWPYTTTTGTALWSFANWNTGTAPNTLFCRNCHPIVGFTGENLFHDALTTGESGGTVTEHSGWGSTARGYCVSCHIVVPHGGKVARLIATATSSSSATPSANMAAAYKISSGVSYNIYQIDRPTSSATMTGTAAFTGAGCNQHSGGTDTW